MPNARPIAAVLSLVLAALSACTAQPQVIPADRFLADVSWLADDARKGRDTDSPELAETAEWVAAQFEDAGLEPLGDEGGWLQDFTVRGRQQLVEGNALQLGSSTLELRRQWIPLATALRGSASGEVVFAGYGISDPEGGYDDYAGLDVKGKVVLALRRGPRSSEDGSRYAENGPGVSHNTFARKVNTAFRAGAAGLLIVNGPARYEPGSRSDRVQSYQSLGPEGATATLPAAHLTAKAATELVAEAGLDLAAAQTEIDASMQPQSRPIAGLSASLAIAVEEQRIETMNVLGVLRGSDPELADEYVVIGAHMDHVGTGQNRGSRGGREARGQIHNGADDNASGTAGLIGAARMLAEGDPPPRTIVFAAWSGEEWGLLGSQHFAEHPPLPLEDCIAAVNMDMIGRSVEGYVAVEGVGSSPGFKGLVLDAHQDLDLKLDVHTADRASDNSDQATFFAKNIPIINFFTGLHDDYHMPSDDVDKINAAAGSRIATLAGAVTGRLAAAPRRPVFSAPAGAEGAVAQDPHRNATAPVGSAPGDPGGVQAYGVVLGTRPDMTYQEDDGVRISGVRPGTPAEKIGLTQGDLIVALDGKPVRNLQDYSVLLFAHKPGDTIAITIERDGERLELSAVLEGHAGEG